MLRPGPSFLDQPNLVPYGLPSLERGVSPAAGASFQRKIDGNFLERLLTVRCKLVTSATVANRQVVLQYLDSDGAIYMEAGASAVLAASQTNWFVFSAWLGTDIYTVGSAALAPLAPTFLPPGFSWKLTVANIQAADALTEIAFQLERYYTTNEPRITTPTAGV